MASAGQIGASRACERAALQAGARLHCLPEDPGQPIAFNRRSAPMRCLRVPCPQLAADKLAADDMRRRFKGNISRQVGGGWKGPASLPGVYSSGAACHVAATVPRHGTRLWGAQQPSVLVVYSRPGTPCLEWGMPTPDRPCSCCSSSPCGPSARQCTPHTHVCPTPAAGARQLGAAGDAPHAVPEH